MISDEAVKRVINTPEWQAVQAHIEGAVRSLDTLSGIDYSDPIAASVEGRARELAADKLRDVLQPFVTSRQETDASAIVQEKAEDAGI